MKNNIKFVNKIFLVTIFFSITSLNSIKLPFDLFSDQKSEQVNSQSQVTTPIEEQIKQLEIDLQAFVQMETEKDFSKQLNEIDKKTDVVKQQLEKAPGDEFLLLKLSTYNKMYQAVLEIEQTYKDIQEVIEKHIKVLNEYEEDPQFKKLRMELKTYYSFDELLKIGHQLQEYEDRLIAVQEKNKTINIELPSRRKSFAVIESELKTKQKQRDDLLQNVDVGLPISIKPQDQGEIIDLQILLLELKKDAAQAKVNESERKLAFSESQRLILQDQVRLLKNEYARVKSGVRVDDAYVKRVQVSLDKKRADSLKKVTRYAENIKAIDTLQEELDQELKVLSEKYHISINNLPLSDWTFRTDVSSEEWVGNALITKLFEQILTYEASKDLIQAQSDLEEFRFKGQEILFDIVESWHKMTMLKNTIDTDEELKAEIKKYDGAKAELRAEQTSVSEKLSVATNYLTTLHNVLDEIKNKMQALKKQKTLLFKDKNAQYELAAQALAETEETVRTRIDATAKLVETYSAQQNIISSSLNEIEYVVRELNLKDFWRPSAQAIDWATELNRIVPDIRLFLSDLKALRSSYMLHSIMHTIIKKAKDITENYWHLLLFLINVVLIGVVFFLLKAYLPEVRDRLFSVSLVPVGRYRAALFFGFVFDFINRYLLFIYPWFIIWFLVQIDVIYDVYFIILFYLSSIPFFIFILNRFFTEFSAFNERLEYTFLSESYEKRFTTIVSWLSYALSAIFFFRSAFQPLNFHQSNLPTLLLAVAVILCQISAILLISKEQILKLIPGRTEIGTWVKQFIDRYYFIIVLILFGIIVMSNPYVGFFKQVSYILSRLVITIIAIPLFLRLHNYLKNKSSTLFFYTEGEVVKERFAYAKAAYSLMVIATFLAFVVLGILAFSRLWDYPITLQDITNVLDKDIMPSPGLDSKKEPIRITAWSFLQVIAYIISGLLLVFFINRMVLGRLFDLLVVNVGVQNTLLTLTRYLIITMSFVMGLYSVHLGYLMNYIGAALLALGFAIKDPISDVICYFVILVQRPIKIGDYISLGNDLSGVVRQISPRSVILRKNNSVTLVVPNSQFITNPIINWNYVPTYFAFDDIYLTISYESNPKEVQKIIFKVLDEQPNILKSPAPIVRLDNFTENGFLFLIRGFISADKTLEQWEIQSQIRLNIVERLEKSGIKIALPSRVLVTTKGFSDDFSTLKSKEDTFEDPR